MQQQHRLPPCRIDLVPLHRHRGHPPEPESRDCAECSRMPNVEYVVEHAGALQPLQLRLRARNLTPSKSTPTLYSVRLLPNAAVIQMHQSLVTYMDGVKETEGEYTHGIPN